jgi:signal transduction histidine kinase
LNRLPQEKEEPVSAQPLPAERVLVACDPGELPWLADMLQQEGFETLEAVDGAMAVEMLLQGEADVALFDLLLPGKSSMQALEEANRANINVPIILFTSFGGVKTAVEAMKRGAADYLLKPLQRREMVQALRNALLKKRLRAASPLPAVDSQPRQVQKLETLGRLTSAVAHDLNNYMTVMLGYSRLMLETASTADPLRDNLDEIQKAAERAATLTRQLLAFSRKQAPAPRLLNLNHLLADMESMLRRLVGKEVTLVTAFEPQLGLVRADPGQLEQVVMNLVLNARDAMPWGGTLTLATARVPGDGVELQGDEAGAQVVLLVSDTGIGIEPALQARLFEPFFTTKELGTGLGLPIVREIIQQAGGSIKVTSVSGQGTTFMVYLPEVGPANAEANVLALPATLVHATRGAETILVVEDNEAVRGVLREFLRKHGYAVLEAASSEEALRIAEEHPAPINLLLTDVVMPHIDGPELVNRLTGSRPNLKVLYMSGYPAGVLSQHGLEEQGIAFLQKPFNMEALAKEVRQVLDSPR